MLIGLAPAASFIPICAQEDGAQKAAREELDALRKADAANRERIEALEKRLDDLSRQGGPEPEKTTAAPQQGGGKSGDAALDELLKGAQAGPEPTAPAPAGGQSVDLYSRQVGATTVRLMDISLDALFAVGTSTATDAELEDLQGGGHDPRKRGFTVQNVELSFQGAVDPYLTGEAHIVYFIDPPTGESQVELEEAFLTTQQLPWHLQLKAGHFFTEFGRLNPTHPHQWDWEDQPVVSTRFFGADGLRNPGARLSWLVLPDMLPWTAELLGGIQNAGGETATSFLSNEDAFDERPIAGRPFVHRDVHTLKDLLYLLRWYNFVDVSDEVGVGLGASFLYGPNATGSDGSTRIYGADLHVKWRPESTEAGWPFVTWQSEVMFRDYAADDAVDPGADPVDPADNTVLASDTFHDWGFYTQVLYGFVRNWAAGIRLDYAAGEGPSGDGRQDDPFRDDRLRVSPLITWQPTHFSRVRLQYNYDHAKHLQGDDASSIWAGVEFLFGAHPAHKY